jgi:cytochrome oxidase Cu insertion factor (SCO1/SenC/PrrC family)
MLLGSPWRGLLLGGMLAAVPWLASAHAPAKSQATHYDFGHHVDLLRVGDALPATAFVDQRGEPFSFADVRGRTIVMSFVYTRCRDTRECPLISAKFYSLQEKLRDGPFHLTLVSLDPSYDRPSVLAAYGRTFGADPERWSLLTGDPARVLEFAARFDVLAFPDQRVGLIHQERTVIVGPAGKIAQTIDEVSWSPDQIAAAARAAANLPSNPLQRFDLWLSSQAVAICGNGVAGFSGTLDLAVVLAIFGGFGWLLYRVARGIFAEGA